MVCERTRHTKLFKRRQQVVFGLAPKPLVQDTSRLEEEIIKVEVWNWKDSVLQTTQNTRLEAEKKRSYQTAINLSDKSIALLGGTTVPQVVLADEGNASIALGLSDLPYRWSNFYDVTSHTDVYVIDTKTGNKTKVTEKLKVKSRSHQKRNLCSGLAYPIRLGLHMMLRHATHNLLLRHYLLPLRMRKMIIPTILPIMDLLGGLKMIPAYGVRSL